MANINPFNFILLAISHDSAFPHIFLTLRWIKPTFTLFTCRSDNTVEFIGQEADFFFTAFHKHPHLKPQGGSFYAFFGVTLSQKEVVVGETT